MLERFYRRGAIYWKSKIILFENLFKPRQLHLAVGMLLTSSVLSTTSKQCFEQPTASFLVCSLIFIEYKMQQMISSSLCEEFLSAYLLIVMEVTSWALLWNLQQKNRLHHFCQLVELKGKIIF